MPRDECPHCAPGPRPPRLGNVHPTFCWDEILRSDPDVDVIVRGEGEATLAELVAARAQGEGLESVPGLAFRQGGAVHSTPWRGFAPDLDRLAPAGDPIGGDLAWYCPPRDRARQASPGAREKNATRQRVPSVPRTRHAIPPTTGSRDGQSARRSAPS